MEHIIKVPVDKSWNGDRHAEYDEKIIQSKDWDFSCQVRINMDMEFDKQ
jgi:hypothetical protein